MPLNCMVQSGIPKRNHFGISEFLVAVLSTLSRVLPRHSMFLKLDRHVNTRDAVLSFMMLMIMLMIKIMIIVIIIVMIIIIIIYFMRKPQSRTSGFHGVPKNNKQKFKKGTI